MPQRVHKMQIELFALGVVKTVVTIISNAGEESVIREALLTGIALLIGGNEKVRVTLLSCRVAQP